MDVQTGRLRLAGLLVAIVVSSAVFGDNQFYDSVTPLHHIYVPVLEQQAVLGQTVPLQKYPLVAETENGYIVLIETSDTSLTLGYIRKLSRLGNATATVQGENIEICPRVLEPILTGYIPLRTGVYYQVRSETDDAYGIDYRWGRYQTNLFLPKTNVLFRPLAVMREQKLKELQEAERLEAEKAAKEAKEAVEKDFFVDAVAKAGKAQTEEESISILQDAISQYPSSKFAYLAKGKIHQIRDLQERRARQERQKALETEAMNSAITEIPRSSPFFPVNVSMVHAS